MNQIGIDVDGVLANFTDQYAKLLTAQSGIKFGTETESWPDQWDWEVGVSKEAKRIVWRQIANSPKFWRTLQPYPHTTQVLSAALSGKFPCYFITSRCGQTAQTQTQDFLSRYATGANHDPNVIVVQKHEDKIPIINAIGLTHYVDDRYESVQLMSEKCPKTKLYLLNRPWNQGPEIKNVQRILSMEPFLIDAELL